jgi:signal transduction histidine kinase
MLGKMKLNTLLYVLISFLFLIAGVFILLAVHNEMRKQALNEAQQKARIILDRNLATHTYFTKQLKPNIFSWTEPFRDPDYFDPTWMSSTYAVREIDKYYQSLSEDNYYYKEAAVNARSPENEADQLEADFIAAMNRDPNLIEKALVRELSGEPYFVTLRKGESMEETCLYCHSEPEIAPTGMIDIYGAERSFGRGDEEVVQAISIRVPLDQAYNHANDFTLNVAFWLLIIIIVLFIVLFLVTQRFIFSPINTLREKALQIAAGGDALGDQIAPPPGVEFRELTQAFNQMSTALRQHQDKLEVRVQERTKALKDSNTQLEEAIQERERTYLTLQESEVQLHQYSNHLEELVEERTQALLETQERMIRQEKLAFLGQIAGSVSHELRNPLSAIKNAAYYLNIVLEDPNPEIREMIELLENEVNKTEHIISDLLEFTRTRPPEYQTLQITEVLQKTITSLQIPNTIEIKTQVDPEYQKIIADPNQINQVFSNLIENAVKAMPDGGKITIQTERNDQVLKKPALTIHITDTGIGIPNNNLEKIFEPLFTTRARGIGLGLSIVRSIIEAHQGIIQVESQENVGSTFSVTLPLYPD